LHEVESRELRTNLIGRHLAQTLPIWTSPMLRIQHVVYFPECMNFTKKLCAAAKQPAVLPGIGMPALHRPSFRRKVFADSD
jgi:hypothetical protein